MKLGAACNSYCGDMQRAPWGGTGGKARSQLIVTAAICRWRPGAAQGAGPGPQGRFALCGKTRFRYCIQKLSFPLWQCRRIHWMEWGQETKVKFGKGRTALIIYLTSGTSNGIQDGGQKRPPQTPPSNLHCWNVPHWAEKYKRLKFHRKI